MSPTATAKPTDLDAIERDAQARVEELREQRQRLAPEALTDADAREELLTVDSELIEAERAAELVPLARVEQERREHDAVEQAKADNIASLQVRIAKLDAPCRDLAEAADRALKAAAKAVWAYADVFEQRAPLHGELREARGEHGFYTPPSVGGQVESALRHHFYKDGAPRLLNFERVPLGSPRPLAACETVNEQEAN